MGLQNFEALTRVYLNFCNVIDTITISKYIFHYEKWVHPF